MEQIKRFLEEDLQTAVQRLAIARQEGQSEESILQLYQTSVQYANLLQMLDQPAVPNQGLLCLLVLTCFVTEKSNGNMQSIKHPS